MRVPAVLWICMVVREPVLAVRGVLLRLEVDREREELVERCLRLRVRGRPMAVRCRLEAGKVRVELVERCLRLRVRGRPMAAT